MNRGMPGGLMDRGSNAASVIVALVMAVALAARPMLARAEARDPQKERARSNLREGNTLLQQGRAAEALAKFTEAYRLFPSPKLHYNLGQAQSQLQGHEAQAYDEMSRFLREATDANAELRAAAETELRLLRARVDLVVVKARPSGADLLVDGTNVGNSSPDTPVVLGMGTHELNLEKDGVVSPPETVTILGGGSQDVELNLRAPAGAGESSLVAPAHSRVPVPMSPPTPKISLERASSRPLLLNSQLDDREEPTPHSIVGRNSAPGGNPWFWANPWFWTVVAGAVLSAGLVGILAHNQ